MSDQNLKLEDIGKRVYKDNILVIADGNFVDGAKGREIRKQANYEASIPRCANCDSRVIAVKQLENGYVRTSGGCSILNIRTTGNAICDHWNRDGETLE